MTDPHEPFLESFKARKKQIEKTMAVFAAAKLQRATSIADAENRVIRPLFSSEIDTLSGSCHCSCHDWSQIRLLLPQEECEKDQSNRLQRFISRNTFSDVVVIGVATDTASVDTNITSDTCQKIPPGIYDNTLISNCIIEPHARVYQNTVLSNSYIGLAAVVLKCANVSCSSASNNVAPCGQINLTVGPESGGGRSLTVTAESTMIDVCRSLGMSSPSSQQLELPSNMPSSEMNVIGSFSIIRDTPTIENVYLDSYSTIVAASSVKNATLLSHTKICNASTVSDALLQWNASIMDHSTVSDTLLMEEAHSGPHSLVASSILGPDVHVSAGEVHASVLGPNTNAHHQSLVISVLWPLGRGNIGYGANVGSNHTGRLPDQETTAGEGTFWGLSTVIKFPVDLTHAPYSIVAAGTNMPPQRIAMPFSLIVEQNGVCNIIPGWVLQSSPYTLSRSEAKFAKRRKAKRHGFYTGWNIIRPDIINMCIQARTSLERAGTSPVPIYKTDKQVNGIGACHMTEKGRMTGIKAYTQCVQLYALRGLLDRMVESRQSSPQFMLSVQHDIIGQASNSLSFRASQRVSWPGLPWDEDSNSLWNHQLSVLLAEFPLEPDITTWLLNLLERLVVLQKDYAKRVRDCKARDDVRGAKTIPGYATSHVAADNDPAVKEICDETSRIEASVEKIVALLQAPPDSARSRL